MDRIRKALPILLLVGAVAAAATFARLLAGQAGGLPLEIAALPSSSPSPVVVQAGARTIPRPAAGSHEAGRAPVRAPVARRPVTRARVRTAPLPRSVLTPPKPGRPAPGSPGTPSAPRPVTKPGPAPPPVTPPGPAPQPLPGPTPTPAPSTGTQPDRGLAEATGSSTPRTPPSVSLIAVPAATPSTTDTAASFSWTVGGSPTSVTCTLDDGPAGPCSSPVAFTSLAVGAHRFVVTVASTDGSASAAYSWTISAPTPASTVALTLAPDSATTSTVASFAWALLGPATGTTCSLDGAVATPCTSPLLYTALVPGSHRLVVSPTGSAAESASYAWTVLAPPPPVAPMVSLSAAPASTTSSIWATFAWRVSGSPTSVTCALDGGPAEDCATRRSYGLAPGAHRFVVTARNAFGSTSATDAWTITG
jgi:large repetitive protein